MNVGKKRIKAMLRTSVVWFCFVFWGFFLCVCFGVVVVLVVLGVINKAFQNSMALLSCNDAAAV